MTLPSAKRPLLYAADAEGQVSDPPLQFGFVSEGNGLPRRSAPRNDILLIGKRTIYMNKEQPL